MFLNRSLSSSVPITATASSTSISDAVSSSNSANIYKLNLAQRSSLNLLASGLSADVNMAIVRDSNANGIVNDGEILGRSENTGTAIENIQLTNLAAGSYFIIVEAGTNVTNANYSLSLGTSKVTGADILWRDTDKDQVGYWRFDGTTYRDTKVIAGISDDWKVEAIGDFDGDKSEDILWRNKLNGELVAYLMDGASGTIRSQATLKHPVTGASWPVDQGWQVIGIGDVNGDSKGDIIWRNVAASAVSIWLMNGTQVLGATPTYADGVGLTVGAGFNLLAVADLNGDGKADLLWQHSSGVVIDWVMDGATRLGAVTMSNLPPAGYKIEAVNDFNGDGKADLFWRNAVGNVQMWLGTGQVDVYQASALSSTSNLPVSAVDMAWQIAGTDDFNGDGKADIAWRHQTLGVMSLWSMSGSQVNYMQNVALPDLSQKPVGASTRLDTVNIIQLAGISDSGESNSDWITNVRAPSFAGVTSAGSTVSLFGNNQLIGETKAAANGTWSIVTTILDDGIYDISQKVTNTGGGFTQQILPKKLMIDGTAADLQITGPINGVAWDSQVELAGYLRDLDPQAKVEYSIKADATLQLSAVLAATIEAPPTPTFLTKKTIGTTTIPLGEATGSQIFKPYEIALKVTDRAGNISTQTYKGMRLNLPELTEESILLGNNLMPNLPDDRLVTNVANANNPNDGSGALYIGVGGGWGYGSTGSGGAGGLNWNASPNTAPTIAASVLNPNEVIGYLPTLRLMLTTAIGVLSNHPATASKKESLKQQLEMLMAVGEVVETNSFYQSMQPMLQGLFANAYAAGGMTKRAAILKGWQFAKDLAISPALTGLQVFQANLYAVGLAALTQNGMTNVTGLKGAIETLAITYAKLNPFAETYPDYGDAGFSFENFLDNLWNNGRSADRQRRMGYRSVYRFDQDSVSQAVTNLGQHLKGQIDPVRALQLLDRTLQAATQVRQLHEDRYVVISQINSSSYLQRTYPGSINDAEFLKHVADLSFEIARSNPTVTVGANPTSEWVETLWEGGNLQSAAGGLSDWFSGFRIEKPVNPDFQGRVDYGYQMRSARLQMLKGLAYADRLVRVADAVDDPLLDREVLKASNLSHLINLSSTYSKLRPKLTSSGAEPDFFLENAWNNSIQKGSDELEKYLNRVYSHTNLLLLSNKLLQSLDVLHQPERLARPVSFISQMFDWGSLYVAAKDKSLANYKVIDPNAFFRHLEEAQKKSQLVYAASLLDEFMESVYSDTINSFFNASSDTNPLIASSSIAKFVASSIESLAPDFALTVSFDLALKIPTKTPRFPVIVTKGLGRVGLALKILRSLGVAAVIGEILLDAEPVAIDEVFTSMQRLKKTGRKDKNGCISGYVIRSSGPNAEIGNEYATFVSGSSFDFGVIDHHGNMAQYDGLVDGTRNYVIEAKRRYYSSFFNSDGTPSRLRNFRMSDFTEQRLEGELVADNCELVYSWHFNVKQVADYVEQEWRNNATPVYFTDYKF